jgi:hypothetical protein
MSRIDRAFRPRLERLEERATPTVAASYNGTLWFQNDRGMWYNSTAPAAEQLAVNERGEVLADLGGQGLWYYNSRKGWERVTTSNPVHIAMGSDSNFTTGRTSSFYAAFAGQGLSRYFYYNGTDPLVDTLQADRLSAIVPSKIDAGIYSLAADYDMYGVMLWDSRRPGTPVNRWVGIWPSNPEDVALCEYEYSSTGTSSGYTLAVDFGSFGLSIWRRETSSSTGTVPGYEGGTAGLVYHRQLTTANPYEIDTSYRGDVIAAFASTGVWRYSVVSNTWSLIVNTPVTGLHYSYDNVVYAYYPGFYLQAYFVSTSSFGVISFGTPTSWAMA